MSERMYVSESCNQLVKMHEDVHQWGRNWLGRDWDPGSV